jgi:hypothetical protein
MCKENRNAYTILLGNSEGKALPGNLGFHGKIILIGLLQILCKGMKLYWLGLESAEGLLCTRC